MPQPLFTPTSTVMQLLYDVPPRLGLPGLATQLRRMLPNGPGDGTRIAQAGPHTTHIDLPSGRLTLALHRDVNRAIGACLTVAVGPRPDSAPAALPAPLQAAEQARLARKLAEAISARFAPNQTIWHITPAVVSAALIEDLLTGLPGDLPQREAEADSVDMARVLAQIEQTLAGRRAPLPVPQRRTAGQGFAMRWPAGKMSTLATPANGTLRPAPKRLAAPMQVAANSLPALPRPDHAGRQRAMAAIRNDTARTVLTLRYGRVRQTMALSGGV